MLVRQFNQVSTRFFSQINLTTLTVLMVCFMALSTPNAFAAKSVAPSVVSSSVNINSASSEQLAKALSGVGIKKAEAIVAYRKSNGKFKKIDDLVNVKGIGSSTLDKNRRLIKI